MNSPGLVGPCLDEARNAVLEVKRDIVGHGARSRLDVVDVDDVMDVVVLKNHPLILDEWLLAVIAHVGSFGGA